MILLIQPDYEESKAETDSTIGYVKVSLLYRKAFELSALGPLAETRPVKSLIPNYLGSNLRTCHNEFAPIDVTEEFITGYCKAVRFLSGHCWAQHEFPAGCQPPCLDLLFEAGPVMIKDENLVANLRGSNIRIGGDELPGDHSNITTDIN